MLTDLNLPTFHDKIFALRLPLRVVSLVLPKYSHSAGQRPKNRFRQILRKQTIEPTTNYDCQKKKLYFINCLTLSFLNSSQLFTLPHLASCRKPKIFLLKTITIIVKLYNI